MGTWFVQLSCAGVPSYIGGAAYSGAGDPWLLCGHVPCITVLCWCSLYRESGVCGSGV